MTVTKPLLDGEKIPDGELNALFQPPPDLPLELTRSTLLVGARGVGKTTLLRYSANQDPSRTIYLSMLDELGAVVRDSAALRDGDGSAEYIKRQAAKAESLVALAILRECERRGIAVRAAALAEHLPSFLNSHGSDSIEKWLKGARRAVTQASEESWDSCIESETLREVLNDVSESALASGRSLKVLFDRADMVPAFAVAPVIRLLDQAGNYLVLVATRPAPFADPDWGLAGSVHPLDHYQVIQVCPDPRNELWKQFMIEAIRAQYGVNIDSVGMPRSTLDAAAYFARDSVRLCLEIVYQILKDRRGSWIDRLTRSLSSTRTDLVRTSDAALRRWQRRFSRTLDEWRDRVLSLEKTLSIKAPVVVNITSGTNQPDLGGSPMAPSALDRFVAAGLSVGALAPAPGDGWFPGARLDTVEIPPLLLWSPPDRPAVPATPKLIQVEMTASSFSGATGRRPRRGKAFVGFRFDFQESREFYEHLRRAVAQHPQLENVTLVHGKLPAGTEWAEKIRRRIFQSRLLVIADVTGCRGDLLFELGIGWGLRRPIMPVVATRDDVEALPRWLRIFNFGFYEQPQDVYDIAASISDHLYNRAEYRPARIPTPVPNQAVLIGRDHWNTHAYDRIASLLTRDAIRIKEVPAVTHTNVSSALDWTAKASLLVIPADGTNGDSFAHFASGVLVAQPLAGQQSAGLHRLAIVYREDTSVAVPDSMVNCQSSIEVGSTPQDATAATERFLGEYRRWIKSGRRTQGDENED